VRRFVQWVMKLKFAMTLVCASPRASARGYPPLHHLQRIWYPTLQVFVRLFYSE
jgi:hypothetical protein